MIDAEGRYEEEMCPTCQSKNTISYHFDEGYSDLECQNCGYRSDEEELSNLQRFRGDLLEKEQALTLKIPFKKLKA